MKYVMVRAKIGESVIDVPMIFPKMLVHKHVAEYLEVMLLRHHDASEVETVSAGFVNQHTFSCSGDSESLGVGSRPNDREIIDFYDQLNGLVEDDEVVEAVSQKIEKLGKPPMPKMKWKRRRNTSKIVAPR